MSTPLADLPHVLSGDRHELQDAKAGRISYYVDAPTCSPDPHVATPLLLIHSINAAASAHEVRPLFDVYKQRRPTYALDLPGFGHSERSDRIYCHRLMVDAVHAVIAEIQSRHDGAPVDALAVSLGSEFLAKAATEKPEPLRSVALVSATGFAKRNASHGPPSADCGKPGVHKVVSAPGIGRGLFGLLTTRASMRFFLRKTWGSKEIDEAFFEDAHRLSKTPGAHRAPLCFVAGYLFCADALSVYKELEVPTWLAHGERGDFTDYSRTSAVADRPKWRITRFSTGALPYFEIPEEFVSAYDDFLEASSSDGAVNQHVDG